MTTTPTVQDHAEAEALFGDEIADDLEKAGGADYWKNRANLTEAALRELSPEERKRIIGTARGKAGGHASGRARRMARQAAGDVSKHSEFAIHPKLAQDNPVVNYERSTPSDSEFCGTCVFFLGDRDSAFGSCSLVEAPIWQAGHCDLWQAVEKKQAPDIEMAKADSMCSVCKKNKATHGAMRKSGGVSKFCDSCFEKEERGDFVRTWSEASKSYFIEFAKADDEKQLVTGIVLEPDEVDSQNDTIDQEEIEQAAHAFMTKSRRIFLQHKAEAPEVEVVESYIAQNAFSLGEKPVKKGSWVMTVKVNDDDIWAAVKSGDFTGFSIRGRATRTPVGEEVA